MIKIILICLGILAFLVLVALGVLVWLCWSFSASSEAEHDRYWR